MIIDFFSLGVTAEGLRAIINFKLAILKGVGQFGPKFQVERDVPHQAFFMSQKLDASAFRCKNLG